MHVHCQTCRARPEWRKAVGAPDVCPDGFTIETLKSVQPIQQNIEQKNAISGLGDVIAAVATPIARALKLGCIDPTTQQLKPESPCAKRKKALNEAVPFNQQEK